jgi:hypothetical protein
MRDLIVAGIKGKYDITVDDPCTTILGIEIHRDRPNRKMRLRQRGSIDNLLNQYLPNWETMPLEELPYTPMIERGELCSRNKTLDEIPCTSTETTTYASKEGGLNWITNTAPDFIFSVRHCARSMQKPTQFNMREIDRVIKCLARIRRTDEDGLWIGGNEGVQIIATTDTSYHSFPDLKSGTGGTIHMSNSTGSIMSLHEKQSLTADSAMAAEGVGGHLHIRRVLPLRYFCAELGFPQKLPSKFYMDNEPFLKTILGQRGCSERSKHILIRHKVLEEAWQNDEIELLHLATANMVADILTKPLARSDWERLRKVLLGTSPMILNDTTTVVKLKPVEC